jgi:(4S)-4-hydroxy-5-phosphonooxypentane-2,3-dione isomerase
MSENYTVIAEFETTPDTHDAFAAICRFDAERSVADEPGCFLFHVLEPVDRPNVIVLYEVYASEDAFKAHNQMPHFKKFAQTVKELDIETVSVRFHHRIAG